MKTKVLTIYHEPPFIILRHGGLNIRFDEKDIAGAMDLISFAVKNAVLTKDKKELIYIHDRVK